MLVVRPASAGLNIRHAYVSKRGEILGDSAKLIMSYIDMSQY